MSESVELVELEAALLEVESLDAGSLDARTLLCVVRKQMLSARMERAMHQSWSARREIGLSINFVTPWEKVTT